MTGAALRARSAAVCLVLAAVACTDRAAPSSAPAPAQDGAAMLRAAIAAEQSIVYTGYKRTICGEEGEGRATRMKVSRTASGRTFLTWDPGGGDSRHWVYESRAGWRSDPELLLRNYEVVVDPSDGPAVAWRETRRLTLRGRRPGRPSLELLVDKERSIVLREEFRDFEGKVWLTKVFDTIEFRECDERTGEEQAEPIVAARAADAGSSSAPLRVAYAPEGFVRAGGDADAAGGLREEWTDGLAAFSVRQRGAQGAGDVEGELRRSRCSGRASVSGVFEGVEVTVVGNLPVRDLESVVRGLIPSARRN